MAVCLAGMQAVAPADCRWRDAPGAALPRAYTSRPAPARVRRTTSASGAAILAALRAVLMWRAVARGLAQNF
jgi:hypothetical protein